MENWTWIWVLAVSQKNSDGSHNVTHVATNANNIDIQDTEHDILEKVW